MGKIAEPFENIDSANKRLKTDHTRQKRRAWRLSQTLATLGKLPHDQNH
jgi:hypothetical protein